jgi:hypothetical protein
MNGLVANSEETSGHKRTTWSTCNEQFPLIEKGEKMKTHRSPMEKILYQQEMDTIITNPKQPVRTFFRKIHYILSMWSDKLRRRFRV